MKDRAQLRFGGVRVPRGQTADIRLKISETYTGEDVILPIRVVRAKKSGKVGFVSAAVHGDELNGTGIIHDFLSDGPGELLCGTLVLVPVVNVFGFEGNARYMPDGRDLNRSFPGIAAGSLAARVAHTLMREIVLKCDFGIDLHTAAFQRTNFPNVRADLRDPAVRELAHAFGCALVVDGKGPEGSLRRAACAAAVPTIILEAGEPYKIEPSVLKIGAGGLRNVLRHFGMLPGPVGKPPFLADIRKTLWVRAAQGGILRFHVAPGDFVGAEQPLASIHSLLGERREAILSPRDGIILGMTTMPGVKPGEPVCHVAIPSRSVAALRRQMDRAKEGLHHRAQSDLATSFSVSDHAAET
ncbi:MAG: succinylglutamate desuccinylase/aspartoacylase family protein [Opitutales bacterium]|nr:succinylglutamate desuccinylase/aspartoacylase family protein [Opitutales bacterium]